jgi:hypothetical protein
VRAREDCRGDLMAARHRLSKLLLCQGVVYHGVTAWRQGAHRVQGRDSCCCERDCRRLGLLQLVPAPQDAPRPPEALAQLAKNQNATAEQVVQLQTANQKLTEELAKVKLESFDRIAALEARVEQLTLIVADRQAA